MTESQVVLLLGAIEQLRRELGLLTEALRRSIPQQRPPSRPGPFAGEVE